MDGEEADGDSGDDAGDDPEVLIKADPPEADGGGGRDLGPEPVDGRGGGLGEVTGDGCERVAGSRLCELPYASLGVPG